MGLTRLDIFNLRVFEKSRIQPCAGLNLIVGKNASGKTTVLEAIHILATGRSFRTPRIEPVIRRGARDLMVTGRVVRHGLPMSLGIRKGMGKTTARINGRTIRNQSELARGLPVQVIHPDSHELLTGHPAQRRGFLDWGIFHHSPATMVHWQHYQRALMQRNQALRSGLSDRDLDIWEGVMAQSGEAMDQARRTYLDGLICELRILEGEGFAEEGMTLTYRQGWREGVDLRGVLQTARPRERIMGYTLSGPHRADLLLHRDGVPLAEGASRGQQKSAVLLLRLAQVAAFQKATGGTVVVMVDDLPSELDDSRRQGVLNLLRGLACQVFVTAIDSHQVTDHHWSEWTLFRVRPGTIDPVV
ncbi:DNA replication and repair protein RecF [Ectothiorhodospira magna]|uniref:DNA replication and repair protein RecF n=1 Tax=Ectothiorhodospira magna TaxID=867345 RepID=A0A1H9EXJ3_9GAMM|nr:DNA replication/repair protein RecF [Ectothiorhodospira magna]SEQ30382.1 DNA replication and repair protein RecF [Ectothiorhodospira magna]